MARIHVAIVSDSPLLRIGLGAILRQDEQLLVVAEGSDVMAVASTVRQLPCHVLLVYTATPVITASRLIAYVAEQLPGTKALLLTEQTGCVDVVTVLRMGIPGYAVLDTLTPEELCRGVVMLAQHGVWTCSVATRLLLTEAILDDAAEQRSTARGTPAANAPRSELTDRELVVLRKAAAGQGETQIARDLSVTKNTVKTHLLRVREKLRAATRAEAIERGIHLGLVPDGNPHSRGTRALRAEPVT